MEQEELPIAPRPSTTNGEEEEELLDTAVKKPKMDSSSQESKDHENRSFASDNSGGDCESVKVLEKLIQQHRAVYSDETLSKHFHGDVLRVATKCWEQVNQSVYGALETKFMNVLDEFTVKEKLTELDKLWDEHDPEQPAWRPSGDPTVDAAEAEGVAIRSSVIPQFEEVHKQVTSVSSQLQEILNKKQQQLKTLETEIQSELDTLGEYIATLDHQVDD